MVKFKLYEKKYKNQIIALILYLQNFDSKVDLSLEEQPDMNDIDYYYLHDGGGFWIAVNEDDDVVGTIGLMKKQNHCGVLKKFFVNPAYRGRQKDVSSTLFHHLIQHAKATGLTQIVLDTPAACHRAHGFYYKMGFKSITREQLPVIYDYPERDSYLFLLQLT